MNGLSFISHSTPPTSTSWAGALGPEPHYALRVNLQPIAEPVNNLGAQLGDASNLRLK